MIRGAIGNLDVAQIVLYAFFVFFAGLIFYLRREDRREGYPLEDEAAGRPKDRGFLLIPSPKTFRRSDGRQVSAPNYRADTRSINATKTEPWPGAPLEPNGAPMLAGVGPGSYAERADETAKTHDGHDLIVPLRVATNFAVAADSGNPIGFAVVGADRAQGGVVKDLWVDRGESVVRYYEVDTGKNGKTVLLPTTFSVVDFRRRRVNVSALKGAQFSAVPAIRSLSKVTLLEEEKITAYYGAGTLYATPLRVESVL
jgi:photosynthetic reaction center H subunit